MKETTTVAHSFKNNSICLIFIFLSFSIHVTKVTFNDTLLNILCEICVMLLAKCNTSQLQTLTFLAKFWPWNLKPCLTKVNLSIPVGISVYKCFSKNDQICQTFFLRFSKGYLSCRIKVQPRCGYSINYNWSNGQMMIFQKGYFKESPQPLFQYCRQ